MQKEKIKIAWQIAYEILARSVEPLLITQIHPCSGQYNCLALLKKFSDEPFATINLNGDSIRLTDSSLLTPFDEMFIKDKEKLLKSIARSGNVPLSKQHVRDISALQLFIELIEHDITIDAAWLDSSYENHLRIEVKDFPTYSLSDKEEQHMHLPWWILSSNNSAIAMCNIDTGELILRAIKKLYINDIGARQEAFEYIKKLHEWQNTITKTQVELEKYIEWRTRYDGYVNEISRNIDIIKSKRRKFREWEPLKFYINITNAKKAKSTVWLDIRFLGQKIGELKCTKKTIKLSMDNNYLTNKRDFGCELSISNADWDSKDAKEFRNFFRELSRKGANKNEGNEEHRIESLILSELLRRKDKVLRNMAPITIGNVRFPMPTPLKASDHSTVKYAKQYGGGIDVFARAGTGGLNTSLCIMELKDENKSSEPPKEAIKQALVYTTFIRELLRSQSGEKWWNLFGFKGHIPNKLILNAICVMPSNSNNDLSFNGQLLSIGGDDVAKLQYIYFTEDGNKIVDVIKSF